MSQITADQAMQIAQTFSQFAAKVEDFRFSHLNALSDLQESALRNVETSLRSTSSDFLDLGINAVLDDAENSIAALGQVTDLLNRDITTVTTINNALQIASSLIQLATAFATLNPLAITSGIQATITILRTVDGAKVQGAGS